MNMEIKAIAGTALMEGGGLVPQVSKAGKPAARRGDPDRPAHPDEKVKERENKEKGKSLSSPEPVLISTNKLKFYVDKSVGKVVVQVIDPETKKVIRQVPREESLRMLKRVHEFLGQLINGKA